MGTYRIDSVKKTRVPKAAKTKTGPRGISTSALEVTFLLELLCFARLYRLKPKNASKHKARKTAVTTSGSIAAK